MKQLLLLVLCLLLGQTSFADNRGIGACCLIDHCLDLPEEKCKMFGGEYMGDGTSCADNPCGGVGGCCLEDDCSVLPESKCNAMGGYFLGSNTTCDDSPCSNIVACCIGNNDCVFASSDWCSANGTPVANCWDGACATGACCQEDGANVFCTDETESDCTNLSGDFWGYGTTCDDMLCVPIGACCIGIECFLMTEDECEASGEFQGEGEPCEADTCSPTGACCLVLECEEETADYCAENGGTYFGDGTYCTQYDNPCGAPSGACCVEGLCFDGLAEQICHLRGGEYKGDDSDCCALGNPCEESVTGACCVDNFCRDDIPQLICINVCGGIYLEDGSSCSDDPNPCDAPKGACCILGWCYNDVLQQDCDSLGDIFDSLGIPGATTYLGDNSICSGLNPCGAPTGACCLALWGGINCYDGVVAQGCILAGGYYVGDGTTCSSNPCISGLGACCIGTTCVDGLSGPGCAGLGGIFQGTSSQCIGNPCNEPVGACCLDAGGVICIEGLTNLDCVSTGGTWMIAHSCAENPCFAPIFGACCVDGECTGGVNQAYCDIIGGEYQGDFTLCEDDPCCDGDLNDDGVVNVNDLLTIINQWGCTDCDNEDLNDDGIVNVSDLLIVVGQWGPCE